MDGTGYYYVNWNKPHLEKQLSHSFAYIWNIDLSLCTSPCVYTCMHLALSFSEHACVGHESRERAVRRVGDGENEYDEICVTWIQKEVLL